MEKYVVSLKLAKKLIEAGYKKETQFYWYEIKVSKGIDDNNPITIYRVSDCYWDNDYEVSKKICSAPLTDELLKELPKKIKDALLKIECDKQWLIFYDIDNTIDKIKTWSMDNKLPNAIAKLLIWYYKNK